MTWWSRIFSRDDAPREHLRAAWLASDRKLYTRLAAFLDEPIPTPARITELAASPGPFAPRVDLGFGAAELTVAVSAGTANARVAAVVFAERVAQLQILISWSYGGRPQQLADLRAACGGRLTVVAEAPGVHTARADRRDADVSAALDAARASELGATTPPDVPAELRLDFEALTALRCGVISIGAVGVAARPSPQPLAAIVGARRIDLLRAILRGPNSAGRVSAACALLTSFPEALDASDRAAIRLVRSLPIPIFVQSGCTMMEKRAAELIPNNASVT